MTWGSFADVLGCVEWWLNRYQTLLVGAVAVVITWRQVVLTQQQGRIIMTQANTDAALARLQIDRVIAQAVALGSQIYVRPGTSDSLTPAFALGRSIQPVDLATFEPNAVRGAPEMANNLIELAQALNDFRKLSDEYEASPWVDDRMSLTLIERGISALPRADNALKVAETRSTLERFFRFMGLCAPEHTRAKAGLAILN